MLPYLSGEFRAIDDAELRFAPSGVAVAKIRCVANSRKQVNGEWVDDKVVFLNVTCFKKLAENVAESVTKGALINVTGRLQTDQWEKDGEKKSAMSLVADTVSVSLAVGPATVAKAERREASAPAENDPWASGGGDEPPF